MLKYICFCTVLYNMGSIIMTLNFNDKGVCADKKGNLFCCFDHKLIDGKCVGCQIGFIIEESLCVPCKTNWYGDRCILKCSCLLHQRCDNVNGCVNKTITTHVVSVLSTICSTDNCTQGTTNVFESLDNLERTTTTQTEKSGDGLSDREIVIYSVVVACIIVILGLSYLVQKYRKKTKTEPSLNTVQITHSNGRQSLGESNSSIYAEIDETMLVENANINVLQNEISMNTDNTSYLYPIHVEDDKRSSPVSAKSVNNSYISIHESDQNHNSDESDKNNDTTSYLHPYHTVDEDWKEKTHQYDITHVSNKDTDDSSDSSTKMITDGYSNPYQPLNEDWKQKSHSYEATVTVHHCQLNSAGPSVKDEELKEKVNDHNQITSYKDNKVAHKSEADILTCNKQEIADDISWNDEMKEISASIGNNLQISKELTNLNNMYKNDPSSTQRENALVSAVESDIKVCDNNDDNPHNCNLLKNVTIHTIDPIHSDQNTNVHDYTDAKSQ